MMSFKTKKKGGAAKKTGDSQLAQSASMALLMLRQYGPPVLEHKEFKMALKQVREAEPRKHSADARLICGQLLFMFSTIGAMTAESAEDAKKYTQKCKPDVIKAWDFIDFKLTNQREKMLAGMLRLDIAQQLQDLDKLKFAYKEFKIMKKDLPTGGGGAPMPGAPPGMQQPDPRDTANLPLFNAAPVLGKWSEFREYAKVLTEKLPQVLEAVKQQGAMSGRDYSVLMEYAEDLDLKDKADDLAMTMTTIKSIRIKLRSVTCPQSEKKAKQIEEDFKAMLEWKDIDTIKPDLHRILRFGGILQMVSFADMPIAMIGPYEQGRLRCRGVAELMKEFEEPDITGKSEQELMALQMEYAKKYGIKQIEQFDLQVDPSNPKLFKGTYLDHLYQANEEELGTECDLICKFDMELVLDEEFPANDPRAWETAPKTATPALDEKAPTPTDSAATADAAEPIMAGIDDLTLD